MSVIENSFSIFPIINTYPSQLRFSPELKTGLSISVCTELHTINRLDPFTFNGAGGFSGLELAHERDTRRFMSIKPRISFTKIKVNFKFEYLASTENLPSFSSLIKILSSLGEYLADQVVISTEDRTAREMVTRLLLLSIHENIDDISLLSFRKNRFRGYSLDSEELYDHIKTAARVYAAGIYRGRADISTLFEQLTKVQDPDSYDTAREQKRRIGILNLFRRELLLQLMLSDVTQAEIKSITKEAFRLESNRIINYLTDSAHTLSSQMDPILHSAQFPFGPDIIQCGDLSLPPSVLHLIIDEWGNHLRNIMPLLSDSSQLGNALINQTLVEMNHSLQALSIFVKRNLQNQGLLHVVNGEDVVPEHNWSVVEPLITKYSALAQSLPPSIR